VKTENTGKRRNIELHRKDAAKRFLQMVVNGQIRGAYKKFVDMAGTHHNPFCKAGFAGLEKGMLENDKQFPNKKLTILHSVGQGDLVAVHCKVELGRGNGLATVHLFRFKGERIVELWDIAQPIPAKSPNKDGAF
jgi:predicted SnoaL-like aldol condensation-catalyzing enzyme